MLTSDLASAIREARSQGATDLEIADASGAPVAFVRSIDRVRDSNEFASVALRSETVRSPRRSLASSAWDVEKISKAIDDQLRGSFAAPVAMARRMGRDSAIFVARQNRVAPSSAVAIELIARNERNPQSNAIANAAAKNCVAPRSTLRGIHRTLVDHGIAIGFVRHGATDDGAHTTARLEEWPLEHVRWNSSTRELETAVEGAPYETIRHGDGNWIVFRRSELDPWASDACVIPAGLIWAAHTEGISSWAAGARSHGQARIIGELPEGITLAREDGTLSLEAELFRDLLTRLATGDDAAGIRPPGSIVEFLANGSTAWQVFDALASNQEKAAARVYLGTDAALGSVGGAPGVDISMLFGVATTLVQGDFDALEQGLNVGLYQPWTAINYGSSRHAPRLSFQLPDPDAERIREEAAKNRERFDTALNSYKTRGFVIDQDVVDALAYEYGVPAPTLASQQAAQVPLTLAPADVARVVRVNEARASQGLPPLPPDDPRGTLFISELEFEAEAGAEANADAAAEPAAAPATEPAA